jgi:Uma2 family endonuclease
MSAVLEIQEQTTNSRSNGDDSEVYRLRVEDYEKMIEFGIFDEDEKIELWDGVLVKMSPKGIKHRNSTYLISTLFQEKFGRSVITQSQDPIRLNDFSEPEPDIVLAKAPLSRYAERHPEPADIYLIVEIADSSITVDRKKSLNYARSGIVQYLILNLNTNEIEDYREPSADGYRSKKTYTEDESFNLVAFADVEIKVKDLVPPKNTDES